MLKKIFKLIFKTFAWIIGVIVVLTVVGYLTMGFWIKPLINHVAPQFTKTSVTLDKTDISLLSGRFALKGLKVGNPAGFSEPYMFELGEFAVQFQPKSIFTDKIIVDSVLIKGAQITAETNQKAQINLMVLNENVQSALKNNTSAPQAEKTKTVKTTSKSSKSVIIKDLQILDTKLQIAMMGHSSTMTLPDIHEKNIGEKKSVSIIDSIKLIVDKLTLEPINQMTKATQQLLKNALDTISKRTQNKKELKGITNAISDLF